MINDHQDKINFSTFRDDTNILMSVNNRYVLFDKDGIFRDEVEFKGLEKPKKAIDIPAFKRMKLLAMSSNNKFFLFEDQMSSEPKFGIYLIKSDSDENIFEHILGKVANIHKKYSENYFFEEFYEIDFFSSKLIIHLQEK